MVEEKELTVKEVMVKNVVTAKSGQTVKEAAKIMSLYEIGSLVVLEDSKVVGILTERDLLNRVIAEGHNPAKIVVSEVMSHPPIEVKPDTKLEEALQLMFDNKIKKLIVIEDNGRKKLVGIVTLTDIARFQPTMIKILRTLFDKKGEEPPKHMEKVMNFYIV